MSQIPLFSVKAYREIESSQKQLEAKRRNYKWSVIMWVMLVAIAYITIWMETHS